MFAGLLARVARITYARYLIASVGALAVDLGLFMALLQVGMTAVAASAVGYMAGIAIHWTLSSRAVFADRLSDRHRYRQRALFVVSALIGLALTAAIVGVAASLSIDPRLGKLAAIAVSFHLTYLLRKTVVFG